jgi:Zn-dependent protease with chaperone function
MRRTRGFVASATALLLVVGVALPALAEGTKITAPKNPYSLDKDVELGRQASAEVERRMRLIRDPEIEAYVQRVGRRLAESIPPEFQHPEFRYSYKVVDAKEINAFALPGGFTYVNRGLIEAASNEGEMAGVIAHEISHVALRHSTAQVAKAQKYQGLALGGAILGAILGGGAGAAVYQGSQLGVGTVLLRFSRDYEKQADLLGCHIMANAGYDPRDLANMFRTIERQVGQGGPQWLSDHPNPGNRYDYILREAQALGVRNAMRDTPEFAQVKQLLRNAHYSRGGYDVGGTDRSYPGRRDDGDYDRRGGYDRGGDSGYGRGGSIGAPTGRISAPSTRFHEYDGDRDFRLSLPDNWREIAGDGSITFAPEGAYGQIQGQPVFTHGAMVGVARAQSRNLRQATDAFLNSLAQGNRNIRKTSGYETENISRREGLSILLGNVSDVTGRPEVVVVCTAFTRNGDLFYFIGVAPDSEYDRYSRTFQRMVQSIQLD